MGGIEEIAELSGLLTSTLRYYAKKGRLPQPPLSDFL
ncbi:MerR family DNA-binding transcriptional regulator [Anaerosacchariphilus sp. NSJ-68]|uniref:MerR family DNA-binding transcriptional regulator n=2 Tax=Lachnospiraceae TaxID=186803 RepID=A0A923LDA2_9FIRM|nr:MerR family DNA-binding transcriptional regulator [Anaerosacchariphilus hominis]MBC5699117.1 MerR family DNA-binding transcriptional regulator [Roseburia difficilis]